MKIYAMDFEKKQAFVIKNPSASFIRRHDNGHLVSIGLSIGKKNADVTRETVDRWVKRGFAQPVDYDVANHSSCQSRCVRRGDKLCQW